MLMLMLMLILILILRVTGDNEVPMVGLHW
jgi:hypothetical protein